VLSWGEGHFSRLNRGEQDFGMSIMAFARRERHTPINIIPDRSR
jgi:hypothetical protein